ncbi:MAG: TonB-dependent receptor [Melioribacteraceae bacterium]|nr:TonB-dependent receptor [Melioribacteraceae bacterium]
MQGNEWNLYSDINYETGFFTGDYLHKFLIGVNWKNDFNTGDGYIFNPLRPISSGYSTPRLRSYDELPSFNTLSVYIEDKIVGRLLKPFTLKIGFRYEAYRPAGINFGGLFGDGDFIDSHNGTYFNPRVNFSYNLFEDTQIRLGYGVTSKAPPMYSIFRQNDFVDIVDTNSVVDPSDPDANFAIVSTYVHENQNEDLKGIRQYKYEASVDQKIGPLGFSLTGYLNESQGVFASEVLPTVLYKKSFPEWPNNEVYTTTDTIFYSFTNLKNNSKITTKGLEFSLRTQKIPVINTIFKFDASYMHYNFENGTNFSLGTEREVKELGGRLKPLYNNTESITEKLLFNYRFDIQAESLGMWITIHVQQDVFQLLKYVNYDTVAVGYYTAQDELVYIPEEQRNNEKYSVLNKKVPSHQLRDERFPNLWLINLKVSKSLWDGAAISFFVNNFFNNNPLYRRNRSSDITPTYERRNPAIFYGMEFQTSL